MPDLTDHLDLPRCPHCGTDSPTLQNVHQFSTKSSNSSVERVWRVYKCSRCGGVVTAAARKLGAPTLEVYPSARAVNADVPARVGEYLNQALSSLSAPAGAVMLAASAVDAMLKEKGLKEGPLYSRIDAAAERHVITGDMAGWAHDVRLDANDQRHADEAVPLPTPEDAARSVDFAMALAEVMFVIPSRVRRGRAEAKKPVKPRPPT